MTEATLGTSIRAGMGSESALALAKVLGGIGALLTMLGLAPVIGTPAVIVGWIIVLAAIALVSSTINDKPVFYFGTVAAGLQIVGSIGLYFVGRSIFSYFSGGGSSGPLGFWGSVFGSLSVLWVVAIASSIFLYMSLRTIGSRLNAGLLGTAAIIFVVGEATTIILIGFVIALIAQILIAVAFFMMPEHLPLSLSASTSRTQTMPAATSSTPSALGAPTSREMAYCTSCGAKLVPGAVYCPYCGARKLA